MLHPLVTLPMFRAPTQQPTELLLRCVRCICTLEIRLQHEAFMQRLDRSHIVVPHETAEFLDLFGRDFDGVLHDYPGNAFRTGWGGEGSGVEVVGLSFREKVYWIHSMLAIIVYFSGLGRGMFQKGLENGLCFPPSMKTATTAVSCLSL